ERATSPAIFWRAFCHLLRAETAGPQTDWAWWPDHQDPFHDRDEPGYTAHPVLANRITAHERGRDDFVRLARSTPCLLRPWRAAAIRCVRAADPHSRMVCAARDRLLPANRVARARRLSIGQAGGRHAALQPQLGHRKRNQKSTQDHLRPHLAGDLGQRQSLAHSRWRLWVQSFPNRP